MEGLVAFSVPSLTYRCPAQEGNHDHVQDEKGEDDLLSNPREMPCLHPRQHQNVSLGGGIKESRLYLASYYSYYS